MSLHVLVTERLSPGLRGAISQWYVEVNPGIYVGTISARIREELWAQIEEWVLINDIGYALDISPTDNEQGYAMRTAGTSRYGIRDYDGLQLVSRQHERGRDRDPEPEIDPGW